MITAPSTTIKETEVAYLEAVTSTRFGDGAGTGPEYRNHGSIRYPIRLYWEWRERGRQKEDDGSESYEGAAILTLRPQWANLAEGWRGRRAGGT
jgi:hypothetical protein